MSESMGGIIPECPGDFVGIRKVVEEAWLTVWVSTDEVLVVKLLSPL
jgi:hypothetical protein